jgi:hypothetical protein
VAETNNPNTVDLSAKELQQATIQAQDASTAETFDTNTDATINPGDIARDEAAGRRALGIPEPTIAELELSDEELEMQYFTETNTTTDLEMDQLMENAELDQDFMEAEAQFRELDLEVKNDELAAAEAAEEDENDTLMMQAEFDQENMEEEFDSRPIIKQSVQDMRGGPDMGDWRVRLRLAPNADYFYNAPDPGIMQPLSETDGVLFPYLPHMTQGYRANYNSYELTHSNYKGHFYQSSSIDNMLINSTFTAQDTREANYMLATIHFLRSATKMFYGQDALNGTPPPLLFLTGLGDYQFNEHPYILSVFNYVLPNDVDYIKAGDPGPSGNDFQSMRSSSPKGHSRWSSKISRLFSSGLSAGAESFFTERSLAQMPGTSIPNPVSQADGITYVPTKIEISLTLLPVQTRDQVSNEFSLKDYASGKLLKKGFH